MNENQSAQRMYKLENAIETITDARDVAKRNGSSCFYRHNGGVERLNDVIECLRWLEDIIHAVNG